jgi:putative colanic acid biosynthesis acetyltransferase WcaF
MTTTDPAANPAPPGGPPAPAPAGARDGALPAPFQRCDLTRSSPYSPGERIRRLAWNFARATLFRWTPKHLFRLRNMLLRAFGARVGPNTVVESSARIFHPWLLEVGDWSHVGAEVNVYNLGPVSIGDHTVLSQGVYLCAGTHDYTRPDLPLLRPPIRIGHGVWIAAEAFIAPAVTVGDNAVVGARSVVTKDVPSGAVVAGNPARVIKQRPMTSGA